MSVTYSYNTEVEWTERRRGKLLADGLPDLAVAPPPEFQGDGATWTPEHLFIGSVNVCFMITFLAIAEKSKLDLVSFRSDASGELQKVEGQGYTISEIILRPTLVISEESDRHRAARALEKAERYCLISNSIKSEVRLDPEIRVNAETSRPARELSTN